VLCSQRPEDVLGVEDTRAAIQNCATKVIFNQDESSADLIRKNFGLTEREVEECMNFSPGEAILLSRGVRVPVYFRCSPSEYERFTTRPRETM
jgi:type IV secretory pathway VirB4 component